MLAINHHLSPGGMRLVIFPFVARATFLLMVWVASSGIFLNGCWNGSAPNTSLITWA